MKDFKKKILSAAGHFLAIGVLAFAFWPFAKNYLFASAPVGNDYYTALNYVEFFRKYLTWPPAGWEYFWFSGTSVFKGYPWFHLYLMQPLVRLVGSGWGMEIYSVAALFLFFVFAYLLFWELAKSRFFSLLLALILLNSHGVFNALPWNGFIAASATQMFLPLAAYLVVRFYRRLNKRWLAAAGLITGLAILGHPLIGVILVFVPVGLILFFWRDKTTEFWSGKKIGFCLTFGLIVLLTASAILYPVSDFFLKRISSGQCHSLACWGDIPFLLSEVNLLFYLLAAALAIAGAILKYFKRRLDFRLAFTFLAPPAFLVALLAAEKFDLISSLSITLWPERITWAAGLSLAAVSAALFGGLFPKKPAAVSAVLPMAVLLLLFSPPVNGLVLDFSSLSSGLGAYPGGSYLYTVDKYQETDVSTVLPDWLNKDELNYRFDCMVYMINYWWNAAVEVPNTRGYVQYLRPNQSYWYSWLTAGMTDWWGEEITRPKKIAQNTARFLIDWYAIRYLEDTNRRIFLDNPYADFVIREPISDRKEEVGELLFYRIAEDETSPIVKASRAKTMLVVGLKKAFVYDNLMKVLAAENLNSRFLVPVRGPDSLDELKKYNLSDFDLIFLNDYRYEDFQSWRVLADYVKGGGKLMVETGTQVRESDSATLPEGVDYLPEVFPLKATKRDSLGVERQLTTADHPIFEGIDVDEFGPFRYENTDWKLSFGPDEASLREGAEVLLRQKGQPVLAIWPLGEGKVVWSGLNLPYHFLSYDRPAEARFFKNIVSHLLNDLPQGEVEFSLKRERPERVKVSGQDFSGVVFKEFFDPGWRAKVNGRKVRLYPAGPDFMYLRVPRDLKGEIKVELFYRGSTSAWFFFLLSSGTVVWTLWYLAAGKSPSLGLLSSAKKRINGWWAKEGE